MTDLFFTVLSMSGYGLVAAVVVMVAMVLLSRTRVSKTALLLLWLIVGLRLVCPWSPPSPLSLFNWDPVERGSRLFDRLEDSYVGDAQVGVQFADGNSPEFDKAVAAGAKPVMNDSIHMQVAWYYEDEAGNVTPAETFRERYGHVAATVWLVGVGGFLCYGGASYLLLKRKLRFAVKDEALPGVWHSESIPSPCVAGLFKPQVYLTFGMSDEEKSYVLAHERQHIRNGDHLWKVLGWLILCVHWFNIWLWAVWSVFQSTLEDACDQRTLRELGEDKKADYGQALLSLSTGRRFRPGFSPLAFGEGDTKSRVKTVLKYKKPLVWLTAVALVLAAGVGLTVLTGRAEAEDDPAADSIEGTYGTWRVSNVVCQTLFSSSTDDYLLDQWREAEVGVSSDLFSISVFENYIARSPVYQPLELGDALLTSEIGGDDPDAAGLFSLDLTKYGSVRGWRVLESTGPEETHDTGWHIFLVDGRLWLGKWTVHENADKPYGEYWYILELVRERTPLATAQPDDSAELSDNLTGQTGSGAFPQDGLPLSEPLAEWQVDLTHDGTDERVYVTNVGGAAGGIFYIVVEDAAGQVLFHDEAATAHMGQNGYYLWEGDGQSCLLNWAPCMSSGEGYYFYRLFSLTSRGEEQILRQNSVNVDMNEVWGADPDELRAFDAEINELLSHCQVLLSTNGDTDGVYGDPDHPVTVPADWDSGADWFEEMQSRAQGTYTFTAQVVGVGEDAFMVEDLSLWAGGEWGSYVFTLPMSALREEWQDLESWNWENVRLEITADGPLYRWRLPDEGTHVEVTSFMAGEPKKPVDSGFSEP